MTREGKLNERAFREVMEFNIQAGVHGFWVAGGTGESILLEDDENMRIAEIAATSPGAESRTLCTSGRRRRPGPREWPSTPPGPAWRRSAVCPPSSTGPATRPSSSTTGSWPPPLTCPFFVYNLPSATGVEITPDLMRKIQDGVPQLSGLKHSALTVSYVRDFADMGLNCLIGNSYLMLPALTIGATGCVDGPPNVAPELWIDIWEAYNDGDLKRAEAAQGKGPAT